MEQNRKRKLKIQLAVFDFDGVFTDNHVEVDQYGRESVRCWRSDGIGLSQLLFHGILVLVLTQETNPIALHRCAKHGIQCIQSSAKLRTLKEYLEENNLSFAHTSYMGNDTIDIACMNEVAYPIAPADAHPSVPCKFKTTAPGGKGAVREACKYILKINGL